MMYVTCCLGLPLRDIEILESIFIPQLVNNRHSSSLLDTYRIEFDKSPDYVGYEEQLNYLLTAITPNGADPSQGLGTSGK